MAESLGRVCEAPRNGVENWSPQSCAGKSGFRESRYTSIYKKLRSLKLRWAFSGISKKLRILWNLTAQIPMSFLSPYPIVLYTRASLQNNNLTLIHNLAAQERNTPLLSRLFSITLNPIIKDYSECMTHTIPYKYDTTSYIRNELFGYEVYSST